MTVEAGRQVWVLLCKFRQANRVAWSRVFGSRGN